MATIERNALGRIAQLGDLYDAREDQFIGATIFSGPIPESCVVEVENQQSQTNFIYEETVTEKLKAFDVEAELKVSPAIYDHSISLTAGVYVYVGSWH